MNRKQLEGIRAMKITFATSELKETVKLLEKVNKSKDNPYIRIRSTTEGFILGVSDGMVTVERFIGGDLDGEPVDFMVNRDIFIGLTKKAKGEEVSLNKQEKKVLFVCGEMKVSLPFTNERAKYIDTWIGNNLVELDAQMVLKGLNKVAYAADFTGNNIQFSGVIWDFREDGLRFVATDSFRLAYAKVENDTDLRNVKFVFPIFPLETLKSLVKETEVDAMRLCYENNKMYFELGDVVFCMLLADITPVNYEPIVFDDSTPSCKLEVNRGELMYNLNMAEVLSDSSSEGEKAVTLTIKDNIETEVNTENGSFDNTTDAKVDGEFSYESTGFYPSNVLDVLKRADTQTIYISFENDTKPMVLQEEGELEWRALVMPVKVRGAVV